MKDGVAVAEAVLDVAAALLRQGRTVHGTALALFVAVVWVAASSPGPVSAALGVGSVGLMAVETWFAVRVGLDARLFERLARQAGAGRLDLGALDQGLVEVGLLQRVPATRSLEARIAGARWLLGAQVASTVLQAAVAALSLTL